MNRIAVTILTLFVGVGADFGGLGLIVEAELWTDPAALEGTPFSSYVVPSYILLFVVGGSNLLAGELFLILIRRHSRSPSWPALS